MEQHSQIVSNEASIVVIDQACNSQQLLVSLSKNGEAWLSPVGWTDQKKVTLLDCKPKGDKTEVDIPYEFAKYISSGDVLVLRCSEHDFEQEIIWQSSAVTTRTPDEPTPVIAGLASGLLSRLKSVTTEAEADLKSETELRAEDAERAAEAFRAKMKAATAAKEEAQRRALAASREAEAALKMEADRIAQMECAAKALEEAERLKHEEHQRVEDERRANQARLAEEARLREEARQQKIAAQKEQARLEALETCKTELEKTRAEDARLKDLLESLESAAHENRGDKISFQQDLEDRREHLPLKAEAANKRYDVYKASAEKLNDINAVIADMQAETDHLEINHQAKTTRLLQANIEYEKAKEEAAAAIERVNKRHDELANVRKEENEIGQRLVAQKEKYAAQSLVAAKASEKMQALQTKYETAQIELTRVESEIDALEQELEAQAERDKNFRVKIETVQQALEDNQSREANQCEAINHLENGGDPESLSAAISEALSNVIDLKSYKAELDESPLKIDADVKDPQNVSLKDRVVTHMRSHFLGDKASAVMIEASDDMLSAPEVMPDPALLRGLDDTSRLMMRHRSSFVAMGAVVGGIALLGGGLAMNDLGASHNEIAIKSTQATQVAHVVSKAEVPVELGFERPRLKGETRFVSTTLETVDDIEFVTAAKPPALIPTPKQKPVSDIKTEEPVQAVDATPTYQPLKTAEAPEALEDDIAMRVFSPLTRKSEPQIDVAAIAENEPHSIQASIDVSEAATIEPAIIAFAATDNNYVPKAEVEPVNHPELTMDVQRRLTKLGMYMGEINGLQTDRTMEAVKIFKTIFDMPVDDKLDAALLTALSQAERNQEAMRPAKRQADTSKKEVLAARYMEGYDLADASYTVPAGDVAEP